MKLFNVIRERLWIKITLPIFAIVIGIMGGIILENIRTEMRLIHSQNEHDSDMLISTIKGALIAAMRRGDKESVKEQPQRLTEETKGLEVAVFDSAGDVSFATEDGLIGKQLLKVLPTSNIDRIAAMLKTGESFPEPVEDSLNGMPAVSMLRPVMNGPNCTHCHGNSRKVLGGVLVRTSIESVVNAANTAHNRSIFCGVLGLVVLGLILYFIMRKLVDIPVRKLLEVGARMRQGDFTSEVEVNGRDEISHMCARMNLIQRDLRSMISEIITASQNLSEMSCRQAASVEQTSASLEEIASMTRQNAENAKEAKDVAGTVNQAVTLAHGSMTELTSSMEAMSRVSQETSQIVKSIDEIAFQTNLLALNAAVEAARAGEVGAGFAVVADEVRNLALRAAEAAGNSTDLINGTITEVDRGVELARIFHESSQIAF